MAIDTKHQDLARTADRSHRAAGGDGEPPAWAKRYIIGGMCLLVLLGLIALAYRMFSGRRA